MVDVQLSNDTARKLLKTLIALGSKKTALSKDRKRLIRKLAGRFGIDFFEIATADGNPLKSRPTDPSERKAFYLSASVLLSIDAEDHDFVLLEKLAKIYKVGSVARKLDFKARDGAEALDGITCEDPDEASAAMDSADLEELKKYARGDEADDEQSKGVFELVEDEDDEVELTEVKKKEPLKAKKVKDEPSPKEASSKKAGKKGTARNRNLKADPKKSATRRSKKGSRGDAAASKEKKGGRGDKRPAPKKGGLQPVHMLGIGAGVLLLLIIAVVAWPDSKPAKYQAGTELENYNSLVQKWNETQKKGSKLPQFSEMRDLRQNMMDLAQDCQKSDAPEVRNAGDELRKLLKSPSFQKTWEEVVDSELTNLTLAVAEDRNKEQFTSALRKINKFPRDVLTSDQMRSQFDELKKNVTKWAGFSKEINKIVSERPVTLATLERAEQFCQENKDSRATAAFDRMMRWFTRQSGLASSVYDEFFNAFTVKNRARSAVMISILRKIKGNDFNSYFNQQIAQTLKKLDPKRPKPGLSVSTGTGFYITRNTIITNAHVVGTLNTVTVYVGSSKVDGVVVAKDTSLDLAIVRVRRQGTPLVYCPSSIRAGTTAFAYGYGTLGRNNSTLLLTRGSVSAVRQSDIVFDGKINPGNSGGPLIDADGRWLGVVVAKTRSSSDVDSLGFAIHGRSVVNWLRRQNISVSSTQRLARGRVPPTSIRSSIVRIESVNLGR